MPYIEVRPGKRWGYGGRSYKPGMVHQVDEATAEAAANSRCARVVAPRAAPEPAPEPDRAGPLREVPRPGAELAEPAPEPAPEPDPAPADPPAPAERPTFACEDCGRGDFKSRASLTRHARDKHPED
jgi:hypothetical protein